MEHVIVTLGREVKYDPEKLFKELRTVYSELCIHEEDTNKQDLRIITHLYRELDHELTPETAKGVYQLVYAGRHVSTIVIQAWLRIVDKKIVSIAS